MKNGTQFINGHRWVDTYYNGKKIAGSHPVTKSGVGNVSFDKCYNDIANIVLKGNTQGTQDVGIFNSATGMYDFDVKSQGENSSDTITFSLPHSMKNINGAQDDYHVNTGVDTKRCSDLISYDGTKAVGVEEIPNSNGVRKIYTDAIYPSIRNTKGYKFDGTLLGSGATNADCCDAIDSRLYITASPTDTGWSAGLPVSIAEAKAYCNGWKLCHSDGASPYYKSEVPYNPTTWSEWNKTNATVDSNNNISLNNSPSTRSSMYISKSSNPLKPSTKYIFTYEVVSDTTSKSYFACINDNYGGAFIPIIDKSIGKHKYVVTTPSAITYSFVSIGDNGYGTVSGSLVLKNIQISELPVGSQIESDANALSANNFSTKYPFYGLCTKYYKQIIDGTGLTSTLPIGSYTGWITNKMLYELATPITNTYPSQAKYLKMFYPTTTIIACEDSKVKPTVDVTARQFGI